MTQVELAKRCGCRRETIGKLEAGKYNPSLKLAMDVARELNASVYDLFFFSDAVATPDGPVAIEYYSKDQAPTDNA